ADRLDFKQHVTKQLDLARGGYISVLDPISGWTQITAKGLGGPPTLPGRPPPKAQIDSSSLEKERTLALASDSTLASNEHCPVSAGAALLRSSSVGYEFRRS